MFTGRFQAILFSIVIHLAVATTLILTTSYQSHIKANKPKAINSYLYQKPLPPKLPEPELEIKEEPKVIEDQAVEDKIEDTPDKTPESEQVNTDSKPDKKTVIPNEPTQESARENLPAISSLAKQQSKEKSLSFSAYQSLKTFNQDLDDAFIEQAIIDSKRPNTGSVMHGQATYVPHSKKQLTEDEKKANVTYTMSSNLKTVKGDDGICFNEEDLSNVGIEGVTARSSFSCGSTKMEKAFKAHMKKLKKKLGK